MASLHSGNDHYLFNRDQRSAMRLNYQHFWMTDLSGYLLHPSIPVGTQDIRIADIATGTGIWSLGVSHYLPKTARLDGFDISAAQFPAQDWLPANVHQHVHDAFEPFPQEHLEAYHVVYMRFVVTLVNSGNVATLLRNLMQLLKPGGYLQWFDLNPLSSRAITTRASSSTTAAHTLAAMMQNPVPGTDYSWVWQLSKTASSLGLQPITHENVRMRDEYRTFWNQSNLLALEDLASKLDRVKATEIEALLMRVGDEFAQGVSLDAEWFCDVWRKP